MEQRPPCLGLKLSNRPVHRRLRKPKLPRGKRVAFRIRNCNQRPELCKRGGEHKPRGELRERGIKPLERAAHPRGIGKPCLGGHKPLACRREQGKPGPRLERGQRLACRGLADPAGLGGGRHSARVDHGQKQPEMAQRWYALRVHDCPL